ncbi:MAG TPA: SMI1/KNR4 family protein [Allosphingosinicella sp.]|nr:SMI1/KNR4 family protein [Allosphingosinicella sp.]
MTFEAALLAWLAYLATLGADVRAQLNPPAGEARIAAAEAEIGFAFPGDLRALYRFADGQQAPEAVRGTTASLFGGYHFASLDQAMIEYRSWKSVYDDAGADFAATYNWTTARAGDPVYADYWRPGWFPFATDSGGNAYAVDLSPPPGGAYGQIILIGRDEDERRVLAPSLTAFLARAAERRPPISGRQDNWIGFEMEEGR